MRDPKASSVPPWLPCTCQSRIIDWAVSIENEAGVADCFSLPNLWRRNGTVERGSPPTPFSRVSSHIPSNAPEKPSPDSIRLVFGFLDSYIPPSPYVRGAGDPELVDHINASSGFEFLLSFFFFPPLGLAIPSRDHRKTDRLGATTPSVSRIGISGHLV